VVIYCDGSTTDTAWYRDLGGADKSWAIIPISHYAPDQKQTTSNQGEYYALIMALTDALTDGIGEVEILMDSRLVVEQMMGRYAVKSKNLVLLHFLAGQLAQEFKSFKISWIPREQNKAGWLLERRHN
jgi:ribonuclease HI